MLKRDLESALLLVQLVNSNVLVMASDKEHLHFLLVWSIQGHEVHVLDRTLALVWELVVQA